MINININSNINLEIKPTTEEYHNMDASKIVVILVSVIIVLKLILRIISILPKETINIIIEKALPLITKNR